MSPPYYECYSAPKCVEPMHVSDVQAEKDEMFTVLSLETRIMRQTSAVCLFSWEEGFREEHAKYRNAN